MTLLACVGFGSACFFAGGHSSAVTPQEFHVTKWMVDNGLPENHITALAQTPDGYLWLGTLFGVVRFDGSRFVTYNRNNTPVLLEDAVHTLAVGPDGALWIGTRSGLYRRIGNTWRRFSTADGLPSDIVWDLAFDAAGKLWVYAGECAGRFPGGSFTRDSWANRRIPKRKFALDENGVVCMLTTESLVLLPNSQRMFGSMPECGPADDYPYAFENDGNGGWWMGVCNGLWHWAASSGWTHAWTNSDYTDYGGIWSTFRDRHGTLWVEWANHGLHRFYDGALEPVRLDDSAIQPRTTAMLEDREGNLWIGSDSGLFQLRTSVVRAITQEHGLPDGDIWSISEAPDATMWVGGSKGVFHITARGVEPQPDYYHAMWRTVSANCVLADQRGQVWRNNPPFEAALMLAPPDYNKATAIPLNPSALIQSLYMDREGQIWIGLSSGVACFRDGSQRLVPGLPNGDVRFSLQSRDGAMWFGSKGKGLFRWRNGELRQFTTSNGLADNYVIAIHEDAEGILWIGTANGLSRLATSDLDRLLVQGLGQKAFFTFTTAQGLFDNLINHILEDDDGFLWFSCNRGIFRIARKELNAVVAGRKSEAICTVFGTVDGMPSAETNGEHQPAGCKARDGRLWFPTTKGVAIVDPRRIPTNEVPPLVVIEQVKANNQLVFGEDTEVSGQRSTTEIEQAAGEPRSRGGAYARLRLPPGSGRVLKICYAATTFVAPERVRFRYRLDGYEKQWRKTDWSERTVFYTNLRPGDYLFRIAACNSHGVWSEFDAQLPVYVAPHFYQSNLFLVVCAILTLLLAWGVHHLRIVGVNRLRRLEQQHALDLERARIARDIHDDLGSRFLQISVLGELSDRNLGTPDQARPHLQKLRTTTNEAFQALDEIVWAANPKQDSLQGLISYLREYVPQYLSPVGIQSRLEFPNPVPDRILSAEARHHLFLVLKEALQNVVKHSKATEVLLSLEIQGKEIVLRLVDNGCGFEAANNRAGETAPARAGALAMGNGLENMQARMTQIGGEFSLQSVPSQGTRISLSLPL